MEGWMIGLIVFLLNFAFALGMWLMVVKGLQKRVDGLEKREIEKDKIIYEMHTTTSVINVQLENISTTLAEVREDQRKHYDDHHR